MKIVIINCFDTIEHRAELLKKTMVTAGHTVSILTSDFRHVHKCRRTQVPEGYRLIHVRPYKKNLSFARLASHADFAKAVIPYLEQENPELLWVMLPPNSLGKTIASYKRKYPECKVVFDVIDMWPESLPFTKIQAIPPLSNWAALRNKHLESADMVVTECAFYWDVLKKYCDAEKHMTIHLAKEDAPFESAPKLPQDKIALCYLGSINNIIDIPRICRIIRAIPMKTELHIIGDGEKREEFIRAVRETGAEAIYHGKIYDRAHKQEIFDQCHFGINVMKDTVYVGLTMKSMDYWEGSLPIINNIKGDTWKFVENHNIGINYADEEEISAEKLFALQKDRSDVRAFFERYFTQAVFSEQVHQVLDKINTY